MCPVNPIEPGHPGTNFDEELIQIFRTGRRAQDRMETLARCDRRCPQQSVRLAAVFGMRESEGRAVEIPWGVENDPKTRIKWSPLCLNLFERTSRYTDRMRTRNGCKEDHGRCNAQ